MNYRGHLSARWDPPGTINEGLEDLDWTSWTRDSHTPDHPLRGGGGYPVRCARKAATVPKLEVGNSNHKIAN